MSQSEVSPIEMSQDKMSRAEGAHAERHGATVDGGAAGRDPTYGDSTHSDAARVDVAGLRVALVLATSVGGVARHVRSLAAGLTERGARVVVMAPAEVEERFGFTTAGAGFAEVDISDRPRPAADARAVARLSMLLRGADVTHAHGLRAGGLAALAAGRSAPPLMVTLHNAVIDGGVIGAAYRTLESIVAHRAAEVLAVSPDLERRMRARGAASVRRALVPSPVPPAAPVARPTHAGAGQAKDASGDQSAGGDQSLSGDQDAGGGVTAASAEAGGRAGAAGRAAIRAELAAGERPLVLTVGRLADQKGFPLLLDAAAILAGRRVPPLVLVAGEGPLRAELESRIRARELPVRLLGGRADVPDLLAAADVVVVPSVWEGQPLVVQEALRAGRPLVATAVGGVPDMVGEDGALLVPSRDASALADAVAGVLDDGALAARLAAGALRRAEALPTEADAVDQVAACYRRLASRRPHRGPGGGPSRGSRPKAM